MKRILTLCLALTLVCGAWADTFYAASEEQTQQKSESQTLSEETEPLAASHTLTFDFAGGKNADEATRLVIAVEEDAHVDASQLEGVQRTGYLFQGWKDPNGNPFSLDQEIQEDLTLTADWKPITYRIKFEKGYDTAEGNMDDLILTYDKAQKLPSCTFEIYPYAFDGWQLGDQVLADGEEVKNLASEDGATVTLTATWRRLSGRYDIRFHANGGTGSMADLSCPCARKKTLTSNKFKRNGYTFAGWNTKKDGTGTSYANKEQVILSTEENVVVYLYAMWNGIHYSVTYDGNGATSGKMPGTNHIYGTASPLRSNAFQRKGYTFEGWNTQKDGKGKSYANNAKVKDLTEKEGQNVTLYAKWKAGSYKIVYKLNGGKQGKKAKNSYQVTTKTFSLPTPSRKGYDFDGWYKDAAFKNRIGEIKKGSAGNLTLYAKWVKGGKKAKSNSAKITQCSATAKGTITVKATLKNRIASSDDKYYLVYVDPFTKKAYQKTAGKAYKNKNLTFTLKTSQNQGFATSMFGVAIQKDGKYKLISKPSFVSNVEKAATNVTKHKTGKTKKGIQHDGALNIKNKRKDLKLSHMFTNIHLSEIYLNPTIDYVYNGKKYRFSNLTGKKNLISSCNKEGIVFTAQLMLDWVDGHTNLIAPEGRKKNPDPLTNGYYQWNVRDQKAREEMEAIFSYMGEVFGQKNCYITNWVLGNEVNCPVRWNYAGNVSKSKYMKDYAYAFRALYTAVRSQRKNSSVFICTDHYWNYAEPGGYSAKDAIDSFAKELKGFQKGIQWNLAFHPYNHPLTYANVWEGYRITNDHSTESITMKNLNVLTNYIKKKYGSSTRIILSELGYTSVNADQFQSDQTKQAAAIAYSYYVAACNPMVDAFIIRSYDEHQVEVNQGLAMGINKKEAYNVFKYMDQSNGFQYTNRYLGVIGASSWQSAIPGFQKNRITKLYRKK